MARVVAEMSMSLDGFIADPPDEVGPLFDSCDPPVLPGGDGLTLRAAHPQVHQRIGSSPMALVRTEPRAHDSAAKGALMPAAR